MSAHIPNNTERSCVFINNVEPPKIHDLTELLYICADINPDFMNFIRQCRYVTKFAVMPKYPNELQITEDDAKTAIRFTEEIKEFVMNISKENK